MSTQTGNTGKNVEDMGLDYNTKLKFEGINAHGGKIFKDNQGRYVVKVEDHPSKDEVILMAKYQGDRYMAPDGVMYLVTDEPDNVGPLGKIMGRLKEEISPKEPEEKPPSIDMKEFRLINSLHVKRCLWMIMPEISTPMGKVQRGTLWRT